MNAWFTLILVYTVLLSVPLAAGFVLLLLWEDRRERKYAAKVAAWKFEPSPELKAYISSRGVQ